MKHIYIFQVLALWLATITTATSQISGIVAKYKFAPGLSDKSFQEWGLSVRAYDNNGNLIASAKLDKYNSYNLNIEPGKRVRIELSGLPVHFEFAPNNYKIHFVVSPSKVDFLLWQPALFTGSRPVVVQTIYSNQIIKDKTIISSTLTSFSAVEASSRTTRFVNQAKIGTVWGLAYERIGKRLFASAFLKRHSALGTLKTGGIYSMNSDGSDNKPFVDLSAFGIQTSPAKYRQDLVSIPTGFSHDSTAFALVGKAGLGGLDASADGRYLWTVNLFDRKLYRIALPADGESPKASDLTSFAIPFSSRRGEGRPFAVKWYANKVYVGVVDDASGDRATLADLRASVLAFDPIQESFEEIFSMKLDYPRGNLDHGVSAWRPWIDDYHKALVTASNGWMIYPQPMLADIEFDTDGSMILSLMDRLGHQTGEGQLYRPKGSNQLQQVRGLAGGDILRVAYRPGERGREQYELEHNGQAGERISAGQNNGEGPAGGEFYFGDSFAADGVIWHRETAAGGLALLPDQDQVLVAVREPETGKYLSGGVKWFNNQTGAAERGLSTLPEGQPNQFGKANSVGDIELITEVPPTEIGDRIWQDCDEDGIQDADEVALANVEVGLYKQGKLLATTKTDSSGRYAFTDTMSVNGIQPRTAYELRVATRQANYPELVLTKAGVGTNSEIDNNAVLVENYAVIKFETAAPGENMHHLDFGFRCVDKPQVTAKLSCMGQIATLSVHGSQAGSRYDISSNRIYTGNTQFDKAIPLASDSRILSDQFANWPDELTVRVFTPNNCFSDVTVKRTEATGCDVSIRSEDVLGLIVSPNPTSDLILLRYKSTQQQGQVEVWVSDMQGRQLISQQVDLKAGRLQTQFNVSHFMTGSYLVTVRDAGQLHTQTVLKR